MQEGLLDPSFIESKVAYDRMMIDRLEADAKLAPLAKAWKDVASVQERRKEILGQSGSLRTKLYGIAETLVHMASEDKKPSNERLREFRDSNRESLNQELFSPAPLYDDLERVLLADELAFFVEKRGGDHPLSRKLLAGKSPRERANELVGGTKLFDVEARKQLASGGLAAIAKSTDPLIVLARGLEDEYRRLHTINDELEELERQAYAKISEAKFVIEGDKVYPDATFSLRLAFGPVKGYELDGKTVPAFTTMSGAFDHEKNHNATDPWVLPKSWHAAKNKMNGKTPFNFVCTADIIGGNSGSPVVDRDGDMVGIIFDGNIQSLTADYYYTDKVSRAVAVHIAGVLEALRTIYGAGSLADQMGK